MRYTAKIEFSTEDKTELIKTKSENNFGNLIKVISFGIIAPKSIQETFKADRILQNFKAVFSALKLNNLVRIKVDDEVRFFDTNNTPNDLEPAYENHIHEFKYLYSRFYDVITVILEKYEYKLHYLIDIRIKRIHKTNELPIQIRISGVPENPKFDESQKKYFKHFVELFKQNIQKFFTTKKINFDFSIDGKTNHSESDESIEEETTLNNQKVRKLKKNLLFPLYNVTIGVTKTAELAKLGVHASDKATDGNFYKYYKINDINIWYSNGIADSIYLTNTNPIPQKWRSLGFNWEKSYKDWNKLLKKHKCFISVVQPPRIVKYDGKKSFDAEIIGIYQYKNIQYSIELGFHYSHKTETSDKGTLYNLRVDIR